MSKLPKNRIPSLRNFLITAHCILFAVSLSSCKKSKSDLDGNSRFGTGAARFVPVTSFSEEITVGLSSFQFRQPDQIDRCFYPGAESYSACDGIAHWEVLDTKENKFKIRFLPGPQDLCLGDFDKLQLIDCNSDASWISVASSSQNSWLIGTHSSLDIFQSVNNPISIGLNESKNWKTTPVEGLNSPYWEYATRILSDPQTWSAVTYTEMAPSIKKSETAPLLINKKVAWFRNNEEVCAGMCEEHGKVCAKLERTVITRGSLKRVHATCTNDYNYFSNSMNDVTIRKLASFSLAYAPKNGSKEKLLRIVSKHKLANNMVMSSAMGCSISAVGCRDNEVINVQVNLEELGSGTIQRMWLANDNDEGSIGSIYFEDGLGQVYKANSSSKTLVKSDSPQKTSRPSQRSLGTTIELNPKDFLTRGERQLFDILGTQDPSKPIAFSQGLSYIDDFKMSDIELEKQININYTLGGFYGFSSGDKISSLGGVFIDTAKDDLYSASSNGLIGFMKKASLIGQTLEQQNHTPNRTKFQFDSVVETSVELFGTIRSLSFSTESRRLHSTDFNALSGLSFHYDLSKKLNMQVIDIGLSNASDFNILGTGVDEATICPAGASDCEDYRLCRVDFRRWPSAALRVRSSSPSGRFKKEYEPIVTGNSGAIHSLRFTFAKRSSNGSWSNDSYTVIAGASEADIKDDFLMETVSKKWVQGFPSKELSTAPISDGACSSNDKNEISGFFGTVLQEANHDGQTLPATISQLGFYFGTPEGVALGAQQ